MREFLKEYLEEGKAIINEDELVKADDTGAAHADDTDVVKRIKELLENYVKPAVEMDGGAISFKSYSNGTVALSLQGSCSGCPSSMITLKSGIEGMMKRMIPEVKEVVAEAN
jgi:Fe-S cluster biogenesis protein NfuA